MGGSHTHRSIFSAFHEYMIELTSSMTEAVRKVPLCCRAKGKLCDPHFGSCNQRLACCTCLSHSRGPATALTDGQPQSSGELGGEHGRGTLGCFARHTRRVCRTRY